MSEPHSSSHDGPRQAEQERAVAEARAEEAKATARAERHARRRTVALVSVVTVALLGGGGAAAWYFQDQATRRVRAEADAGAALTEARTWLDQEADQERRDPERWATTVSLADAAMRRAENAVGSALVEEGLRQRVQALREEVAPKLMDSRLRVELDRIRLEKAAVKEGHFDSPAAAPRYRAALDGYGIDLNKPDTASAMIRSSRLRSDLLAALEDWWRCVTDTEEKKQLLAMLVAVEPGQEGLRARWRAAVQKGDGAALAALAGQVSNLPAAELVNLAIDLRQLKEIQAAERLLREAQERYPADFWVNHDLGIVLLEQVPPRAAEAVRYLTVAAALRSQSPGVLLNLGNALKEEGKVGEAIAEYHKAIELDPKYAEARGALGQALLAQGDFAAAQQSTRRCLELLPTEHTLRDGCVQQLRQCEAALALNEKLAAVLRGDAPPANTAEALALTQLCQHYKQMHVAAARFYADAFAAEPKLAADIRARHRYNAACSAALAGCGQGKGADKLDAKERARLRKQARDWLRTDLDAWRKQVEGGKPQQRAAVLETLVHWQQDVDLAGVRDDKRLQTLAADERDGWRQLWEEVAALTHKAKASR